MRLFNDNTSPVKLINSHCISLLPWSSRWLCKNNFLYIYPIGQSASKHCFIIIMNICLYIILHITLKNIPVAKYLINRKYSLDDFTDTKVSQKFCNIFVMWSTIQQLQCFCWNYEDDEPHWTVRCWACLIFWKSMVLSLPDLALLSRFLQPKQNFLTPYCYCTEINCTFTINIKNVSVSFMALWPNLNSWSISSWFKLYCISAHQLSWYWGVSLWCNG